MLVLFRFYFAGKLFLSPASRCYKAALGGMKAIGLSGIGTPICLPTCKEQWPRNDTKRKNKQRLSSKFLRKHTNQTSSLLQIHFCETRMVSAVRRCCHDHLVGAKKNINPTVKVFLPHIIRTKSCVWPRHL